MGQETLIKLDQPRNAALQVPLARAARRVAAGVDLLVAVRRADFARMMIGLGDLIRG